MSYIIVKNIKKNKKKTLEVKEVRKNLEASKSPPQARPLHCPALSGEGRQLECRCSNIGNARVPVHNLVLSTCSYVWGACIFGVVHVNSATLKSPKSFGGPRHGLAGPCAAVGGPGRLYPPGPTNFGGAAGSRWRCSKCSNGILEHNIP